MSSKPTSQPAPEAASAAHAEHGLDVSAMFAEAVARHQNGRLAEAQALYSAILRIQPEHFGALHLTGVIATQSHDHQKAVELIVKAIAINPDDAAAHSNLGAAHQALKNLDAAIAAYDKAIALKPAYAEAYHNRGMVLQKLGQPEVALADFNRAIALRPNYAEAYNNRGMALQALRQFDAAKDSYDKAIALNPNYTQAYSNLGDTLMACKQYEAAIASYNKAIALNPGFIHAYNNRGNAYLALKQYENAIVSYDKVIALNPGFALAYQNRGNVLQALGQYEAAIASYDQAIALNTQFASVYYNRGNALQVLKQYFAAIADYDKAITLNPDYVLAYNNRGNALQELRQYDAAIDDYDKAIKFDPDNALAYRNRGNVFMLLRQHDAAAASFARAYGIKPELDFLLGDLLLTRMQCCEWVNLHENLALLVSQVETGAKVSTPFPMLGLVDSPTHQHAVARLYAEADFPEQTSLGPMKPHAGRDKIRIGYYSADFHNHATAYLMAQLFEAHDASRFELYGFSFGPDNDDQMRRRVATAFDRFMDVRGKSDREVAKLSRELGIDIAIDLKGFTTHSRTGIFAERCAPVQVSYLGYPGTLGASYMDYLIADHTLIPEERRADYTEKIVYLPDSYQVNDARRAISERNFSREELGLPEKGFVFCCFNNSYKILPATFDGWMRILLAVEGSVLWLLEDNPWMVANLRREAEARGVAGERLIFAPRLPLAEHLARHRQAGLFLDTLPYNAHTTASDALWAGLPVLTLMGQSFASRVVASLLNAIGLSELITQCQEDYETLAIDLASRPERLAGLKTRLEQNRLRSSLFDGKRFAGRIEAAFEAMYARCQAGMRPDHIRVEDEPVEYGGSGSIKSIVRETTRR